MTNLCFVVYDLSIVGGVERVVENLVNKLCREYTIYVVSLHGKDINPAIRFYTSIKVDFLNIVDGRLRNQMIDESRKLGIYFKRNRIQITILEATYAGFIGSPLGLLSRTKIVFCDHGALLNQIDDNDVTGMRKLILRLANKTVVLTLKSKQDYERMFRISDKRITYIYNWINDSMIDTARVYDIESKIIVTAGRFTREKGYDLLLKVAKLVLGENKEWSWHLYGDGPMESVIRKEINNLGLEKSVILKGFSPNMKTVYEKFAIYVFPSYHEGVLLVLLEAKAYKLPSVSFDIITGPNEIIEDEINGFLIKPYDIEQMAEKLNYLINNPDYRKKMSDNAYSNIERFSENHIYRQWVNLIEDLK